MSWVLASVALLVAALALREARRAARPVPPPPSPPPPSPPPAVPREDFSALEARLARVAEDQVDARGAQRSLEERLTGLERRLDGVADRLASLGRELEEVVAPPPPPPEPSQEPESLPPEQQVYDHLRAEGWEEIVLLPVPSHARTWQVEARKAGQPAKGRARLFEDGRVEARIGPPTRAFP